ncbi:MAG: inorganic phosphate transporter [Puniceicoccales bacterium]|jgi:PiT family inorganic phosphate transporter|nr:inorganic phosphate transporter [Puniceicoccales bacterium]
MCGATFVLILAAGGAFFVAFNNGANDVANAFASAVGAKALKIKHALLIAAVLNLTGALVLGSNVSKTLVDGVINIQCFKDTNVYVAGMLACMVAAGGFIFISTHTGLPVSSTHAIVGGFMGIAMVTNGFAAINWKSFLALALSWIFTPFVTAICSFGTLKLIKLTIYRSDQAETMRRACKWIPIFTSFIIIFICIAIARGVKFWHDSVHRKKALCALMLCVPLVHMVLRKITRRLTEKFTSRGPFGIEHVFRRFQAGTSCLLGFAIGSNDVANSVAPVIVIYLIQKFGTIPASFASDSIPIWMLAVGGIGMSVGVLSLGHKVIGTLGKNITLLTNSKGFSVDFATAMTIISASVFGIPVSSTHAATGAIIGVGVENGLGGLNLHLLLRIFITWLITVPASAIFTIFIYFLVRPLMLLFF